jgi:hypothetical protein
MGDFEDDEIAEMERKLREAKKKRFKEKHSERMRALNADPAFKEKMRTVNSERMRALHADPAFKEKHSERMRALNADPAFKEKHSERMRALNADPAFNPLAGLTEEQRKHYRKLCKNGFSKQEALEAVRETKYAPRVREAAKPTVVEPAPKPLFDFSGDDIQSPRQ